MVNGLCCCKNVKDIDCHFGGIDVVKSFFCVPHVHAM